MSDTSCHVQLHVCNNHIYFNATMEFHMTLCIRNIYTLLLYISSMYILHKELHVQLFATRMVTIFL
jgi:hypothetical protein